LYTPEEETANSVTHFLSGIVILLITILLYIKNQDVKQIFPLCIMSLSMSWVFFSSYLYHSTTACIKRERNRFVDRCAIYIAIAGNGISIALLSSSITLIIVCSMLILILSGILLTNLCLKVDPKKTVFILPYILLGWIAILPATGLFENEYAHFPQIFFLMGGGVAYSLGIIFFTKDLTNKWYHTIWHLFVMLGCSLHYIGMCISLDLI